MMKDEDKIEIVEIGLDEDLAKRMKEAATISKGTQIRISNQMRKLKKVSKSTKKKRKWEGKIDKIFNILKEAYDKNEVVHRDVLLEAAECESKQLPGLILKIRTYLRNTQNDKWVLMKKQVNKTTHYYLCPFS